MVSPHQKIDNTSFSTRNGEDHASILGRVALRAVVFDVDFTLAVPGPDLGQEGYRRVGERHGLRLDPARYDEARRRALAALERHPELEHDEEIWVRFTRAVVEGMGGAGDTYAAAVELTRAWEEAHHFELYDDVLPVLEELRRRGLRLGLLSNTARDLDAFVAHHRLDVDAVLTSRTLGLLGVEPPEAAMVGDTIEDDVEGARAVGMRALLLDRAGRYPDVRERLEDLRALPAALSTF